MKKPYKIHAIASYLSETTVMADNKAEAMKIASTLNESEFQDIQSSRSLNIIDCHETA